MSKGLGGWQRLGIVLAIAWTLVVAFIVWNHWPVLIGPFADFPDQPVEVLAQLQSQRSEVIRVGLMLWLVPLFAVATAGYASRLGVSRIPAPA